MMLTGCVSLQCVALWLFVFVDFNPHNDDQNPPITLTCTTTVDKTSRPQLKHHNLHQSDYIVYYVTNDKESYHLF